MKRRLITLGILILVSSVLLLVVVLVPHEQVESFPSPNGYETLVSAIELLPHRQDIETMDAEELSYYVIASREALKKARKAFEQDSRVVFNDDLHLTNQTWDISKLSEAFTAEGRLFELQSQYGDAAKSYIDAIRVGFVSSKGGTVF